MCPWELLVRVMTAEVIEQVELAAPATPYLQLVVSGLSAEIAALQVMEPAPA